MVPRQEVAHERFQNFRRESRERRAPLGKARRCCPCRGSWSRGSRGLIHLLDRANRGRRRAEGRNRRAADHSGVRPHRFDGLVLVK